MAQYDWLRTIDVETGETIARIPSWLDGPADLAKSQQNPYGTTANNLQQQNQKTGTAQQQAGQANQATAQSDLSQFEGPVQQSPMYKALLTSGVEGTSNAYQGTMANQRQRANQAGYGVNQPAEVGAEGQIAAQEAGELARQPGKAYMEAAPLNMEAAKTTANLGTQQVGEGTSALNSSLQDVKTGSDIWGQNQNAKKGFWKTLATLGGDVAGSFMGDPMLGSQVTGAIG